MTDNNEMEKVHLFLIIYNTFSFSGMLDLPCRIFVLILMKRFCIREYKLVEISIKCNRRLFKRHFTDFLKSLPPTEDYSEEISWTNSQQCRSYSVVIKRITYG
jgi:hypothetical protein